MTTRARRGDPSTSKEAADRLTADKLTTTQALVLGMFRTFGKMHDGALLDRVVDTQRAMGIPADKVMSPSAIRTRRSELSKPNMDRLDQIVKEMGDGIELFVTAADIDKRAREQLRVEGFRSPLWDTGERVIVKGSRVTVWGLAV